LSREQAQALSAVLAAFDAHGGIEGLSRLRRCKLKSRVTVFTGTAGPRSVIWEDVFEEPGNLRRRVLDEASGELLRESVLTGDEHWGREPGGQARELPPASVEALLPAGVGMLRLLRRGQQADAEIDPAPQDRDSTLEGALVALPGEPDTALYFDRQTHLLRRVRQADRGTTRAGDGQFALEIELAQPRDFGGLLVPVKATASRDGKQLYEATLLELEPLERVDPGTFDPLD
jgi:hypothetical protein